jgi:hypothetical protein
MEIVSEVCYECCVDYKLVNSISGGGSGADIDEAFDITSHSEDTMLPAMVRMNIRSGGSSHLELGTVHSQRMYERVNHHISSVSPLPQGLSQELPQKMNQLPSSLQPSGRSDRLCGMDGCHNDGTVRCSRYKSIYYCSKKCQAADWKLHKKICQPAGPGGAKRHAQQKKIPTADGTGAIPDQAPSSLPQQANIVPSVLRKFKLVPGKSENPHAHQASLRKAFEGMFSLRQKFASMSRSGPADDFDEAQQTFHQIATFYENNNCEV